MNAKAIVPCIFLGLFCLGLYDVLKNYEDNNCEMTYMFEMPEYLKIKLSQDVAGQFPHYNLYFYGEGQYAWDTKHSEFHLTGIPVLFIPGNAGSYRQVRSLGSVALRMAKSENTKFHFNYFALDLSEELSGMYGPVLSDQTEFTFHCIRQILSFYSSMAKNRPKSVFLVGHSMGGLIARALYALPEFDPALVNVILTQATPHQMPVVLIDPFLFDFYRRVNDLQSYNSSGSLENVLVISTGGGHRDILVRNGLTSLCKIVDVEHRVSSSTMSVPKAWVSTDHLAHVWCKQIVMATVRAMFDCVDRTTNQIYEDQSVCRRAFLYHYQSNSGPTFLPTADTDVNLRVNDSVRWEAVRERFWNYEVKRVAKETYYTFEISGDVTSGEVALFALTNMNKAPWIGGCSSESGSTKCKELTSFDNEAFVVPPSKSNFKAIHLDETKFSGLADLVVRIPKSKIPVKVIVDIYKVVERHLVFDIPHFLRFLSNSLMKFSSEVVVLDRTDEKAVFYNLTMKGLESPFQAYAVEVSPVNCTQVPAVTFTSFLKLHVPWNYEHTYTALQLGQTGRLSLKLQSGKPAEESVEDVQLHLHLEPSCSYRVTIRLSWSELFGQFVRFYGVYLPAFIVIQVLMAITWQLKKLSSEGIVPSFSESHSRWALPYRVVPVAMLFRFIISKLEDTKILKILDLPADDTVMLKEQDIWLPMLPLLLYVFAFSFMAFYGRVAEKFVALLSIIGASCYRRCCGWRSVETLLSRLPYILLVLGAVSAFWLCGTLGLIVGYVVHLSRAVIYRAKAMTVPDAADASRVSRLSFSLALLLMTMIIVNSIPFVVWSKGLALGNIRLLMDPSRHIGTVTCVSSLVIIYTNYSFEKNLVTSSVTKVSYVSSVLMVIYAMVSVYRISYFVSVFLLVWAFSTLTASGGSGSEKQKTF